MLFGDRLKYLGLVAGLAFASFLINQQASIFMGYASRTRSWITDTVEADLWVMNSQIEYSEDQKTIPSKTVNIVKGTTGVSWAVPLYKGFLKVRLPDSSIKAARIVGIDDDTLIGGPPQITEGSLFDLRRDKAVMVDQSEMGTSLAMRGIDGTHPPRALKIGDQLSINDNDALVVGTYRRTREFFWEPVLYTTYSRALSWAPRERQLLSYVLVKVRDKTKIAEVAKRIKERTGLVSLTAPEFKSLTMWFVLNKTGILVNFGITIFLGIIIGILVSGQLFYTFILDNSRHFAAMKAMGVTNRTLRKMIFVQLLTVGSIGYGIGLGGAGIMGVASKGGSLAFTMTWHVPIFSFFAMLLCCLLAASLSMRRVMKLEPAIVFKG